MRLIDIDTCNLVPLNIKIISKSSRLVMLSVGNIQQRNKIISNFYKNRKNEPLLKNMFVSVDLCFRSRQRKRKITPMLYKLRKENRKVYLKSDILVIDGKDYFYSLYLNDLLPCTSFLDFMNKSSKDSSPFLSMT